MSDGPNRFELPVCDSSPLITLAAGGGLDTLLLPELPVNIPDMVFYEVTHDLSLLGAEEVNRWVLDNQLFVRIIPTNTYKEYLVLKESMGDVRFKNRGEIAALELMEHYFERNNFSGAIFLYEDADVERMQISDQITKLTTGDFLTEMEKIGLLPATRKSILDKAESLGRNVDRQREPRAANEAGRNSFNAFLADRSHMPRLKN